MPTVSSRLLAFPCVVKKLSLFFCLHVHVNHALYSFWINLRLFIFAFQVWTFRCTFSSKRIRSQIKIFQFAETIFLSLNICFCLQFSSCLIFFTYHARPWKKSFPLNLNDVWAVQMQGKRWKGCKFSYFE